MAQQLESSKFLNPAMVATAVHAVVEAILDPPRDSKMWRASALLAPKHPKCHVVVVVPGVSDFISAGGIEEAGWMEQMEAGPLVIFDESFNWGNGEPEGPYDQIARLKAHQLWNGRNDGRAGCIPHLLFYSDTPYYGGVKREGIVVACSGVQPYNDTLISSMIADMLIAMAQAAFAAWKADPARQTDGGDILDINYVPE